MGKKGNGEGNIRQRKDGRYEARYCVDTPKGLKRRSIYGKTRKEVADKLAAKLANKDSAPVEQTEQTTITVRAFFGEYEVAIRDTIKRRSYETSRDIIRLHILPEFGDFRLRHLDRVHIQRLYRQKRDAGLSPARVKRIHDVLAAGLNQAVRWRYLAQNPCDGVLKPKVPAPEIRPFSKDEARRFIAAAAGERYEALFLLGLTSGARWGELAGLQWRDLDLDGRLMHIQRALVNSYGGHSFDTPKTSGSRRSVGLTRKATDSLLRHQDRMRKEGHKVSGSALVFVNKVGKPLHASNFIRRNFKPLLKRANLPDTNWHAATRHTCTCILLLEGVNPTSARKALDALDTFEEAGARYGEWQEVSGLSESTFRTARQRLLDLGLVRHEGNRYYSNNRNVTATALDPVGHKPQYSTAAAPRAAVTAVDDSKARVVHSDAETPKLEVLVDENGNVINCSHGLFGGCISCMRKAAGIEDGAWDDEQMRREK